MPRYYIAPVRMDGPHDVVRCAEAEAEMWGLYERTPWGDDWIEDCDTRDEAEAALAALGAAWRGEEA